MRGLETGFSLFSVFSVFTKENGIKPGKNRKKGKIRFSIPAVMMHRAEAQCVPPIVLDGVSAVSISVLIIRASRCKGHAAYVAIKFPDAQLYNPLRRFE